MKVTRAQFLSLSVATVVGLSALTNSSPAFAAPKQEKDGFYITGSGVRVKKVVFANFDVYEIWHYIKELPAPDKSDKASMIAADVDKRFAWTMLRDVDAERIQKALREAFAMNGYSDSGKIDKFVGGIKSELKEKSGLTISYSAANKTTTLWVQGQGSVTVDGVDFMHAVWSIWFGKIDQPKLGDDLIKDLKS